MKVKIIFEPATERERAALKLLGLPAEYDAWPVTEKYGEPERAHRFLGALIDILKLSIVP